MDVAVSCRRNERARFDHRWYLVAFDLDRDDWRTFRVDRITAGSPPACAPVAVVEPRGSTAT